MITDWETNFTDLQANEVGNLRKNNSGNVFVGDHAVIFTEIDSPRMFFFSVGNVCVENGSAEDFAQGGARQHLKVYTSIFLEIRAKSRNLLFLRELWRFLQEF